MDQIINGLYFFENFFSKEDCQNLINGAIENNKQLENNVNQDTKLLSANIPQPEFVTSENQNLSTEEKYTSVKLVESNKTLLCEYFPTYGEDGHSLAYFRGNKNIPNYVKSIISSIENVIDELNINQSTTPLQWRLTLNFYKHVENVVAGFPFHVDIPANGVSTMILNIHNKAVFQIKKDDVTKEIELPIGSLLILSGESRYEWKHRVLPSTIDVVENTQDIQRISLVLGYK